MSGVTPIVLVESAPHQEVTPAPARAGRFQRVAMWLVPPALAVLYAPTILWLFERWTMGIWYNGHGLLIPPAVAYFAHHELRRVRAGAVEGSVWGFAFVGPALGLHVLDTGMHTQLLSAVSIVLLLPGLSLLFLGTARTRAIAFPLAFLALMLPIPLSMTGPLHLALREVATAAAASISPWLGLTVHAEGTTLHLPEQTLEVADACSGFSTLYAALAVAALVAYQCPRPQQRMAVLLLAGPIAVATNVLRVLLLVVLVHWQGVDILETWVHSASGVMTFAIALPVIFWLGEPPRAKEAC